jgi:hypothetical protein
MAKLDDSVPPVPVPPAAAKSASAAAKAAPAAVTPVEPKPRTRKPATAAPVAPAVVEAAPAVAAPSAATSVSPYAAPAAPAQQAYVPVPAGPPQGLAIASMVTGLAGLLFSLIAVGFGFLASVAAVVTGHMAQKKQPYAKGFWLTGIITGYIGIAISIFFFIVFVVAIAFVASVPGYNY